ncbi:unnamed protein product, partial [Meganyctiphanes norvegica]
MAGNATAVLGRRTDSEGTEQSSLPQICTGKQCGLQYIYNTQLSKEPVFVTFSHVFDKSVQTKLSLVNSLYHSLGEFHIHIVLKAQVTDPSISQKLLSKTILLRHFFILYNGGTGSWENNSTFKIAGVEAEDSRSAVTVPSRTNKTLPTETRPTSSKIPKTTRWIVCPTFKELQKCLKIPQNPLEWTVANVRQWLSWAVCQFGLTDINLNGCTINGPALFNLSQTDFRKLIPEDPGDVFYMHFELLRRTHVVAVVCDPNSTVPRPAPPKALFTSSAKSVSASTIDNCKSGVSEVSSSSSSNRHSGVVSSSSGNSSSLTGTNGTQQIQLWQFLLEMLTDPKLYPIMSWCGSEGEFRLHQPEVVANLWGQRKSKPNMNYEKLSRALRYYYDGDMIAKVSGKRFVYKFVLDLKSVVGYSADELRQQVEECAVRDGLSLEA